MYPLGPKEARPGSDRRYLAQTRKRGLPPFVLESSASGHGLNAAAQARRSRSGGGAAPRSSARSFFPYWVILRRGRVAVPDAGVWRGSRARSKREPDSKDPAILESRSMAAHLPEFSIMSCMWCSVNRPHRMQFTSLSPTTACSFIVDVTVEKPAGLESEVAPHFCAKLPLADLARWEKTAPHLGAATRKAPLVVQANVHAAMPVRPFPRPARHARAVSADHRAL